MKIQLIAHTVLSYVEGDHELMGIEDGTGYIAHPQGSWGWDLDEEGGGHWETDIGDADELAEFAGRVCYQSWNRPNPKTATNEGYLANIIHRGHFSVLEHASATFYITGVSRSLTHELIRHRHLSYSELSQRYVDVSDLEFVVPPAFMGKSDLLPNSSWEHLNKASYQANVRSAIEHEGLSRKDARGAARNYLPQCIETRIVVSGNHRAFRDFLGKRLSPAAEPEIRGLAREMLVQLKELAPNCYQDFEVNW